MTCCPQNSQECIREDYRGYLVEWCTERKENLYIPSFALTPKVADAVRVVRQSKVYFSTHREAMDLAMRIVREHVDTLIDGDFGRT
jgi:hypothetical protein